MHLHFFFERSMDTRGLGALRPCVHCDGLTRGRCAMPVELPCPDLYAQRAPLPLITVLTVPMCGDCYLMPSSAGGVEHIDTGEPGQWTLLDEPTNARTGHHRDCLCSLCTRDARPCVLCGQHITDGKPCGCGARV